MTGSKAQNKAKCQKQIHDNLITVFDLKHLLLLTLTRLRQFTTSKCFSRNQTLHGSAGVAEYR